MELEPLAAELELADGIEESTAIQNGTLVKFRSSRGEYDSLSSEILTIIGRYDVEMYHFPEDHWNYMAVLH